MHRKLFSVCQQPKTWTFAKNFFGFASENKTQLLLFTSERLLKQTFPCNTQLQTNIFVHRWLPTTIIIIIIIDQ